MTVQIKIVRIIFIYKFADISDEKTRFFRATFFSRVAWHVIAPSFPIAKVSIHYDAMRFAPAGGSGSRLPSPEDMTSSPTRCSPTAINGK